MGPGTHYDGDLTFEGRVRVDGHFEGRMYTEDVLEVANLVAAGCESGEVFALDEEVDVAEGLRKTGGLLQRCGEDAAERDAREVVTAGHLGGPVGKL